MNGLKNICLTALLASSFSWADSVGPYNRTLASEADYVHAIQPAIGFNGGNLVLTVDYEYRLADHFGFGGSFYFTPEDDPGYAQILGFGVNGKIHAPLGDIDLYLRPGIGVAFVEYSAAGKDDDATIISPFFGVGAMYRIAANVGIGVEYLTTFNWTSDDIPGSKHDFLIATQIRF